MFVDVQPQERHRSPNLHQWGMFRIHPEISPFKISIACQKMDGLIHRRGLLGETRDGEKSKDDNERGDRFGCKYPGAFYFSCISVPRLAKDLLNFRLHLHPGIGNKMIRAKTSFDKLSALSNVEGPSTPCSKTWDDIFLCVLGGLTRSVLRRRFFRAVTLELSGETEPVLAAFRRSPSLGPISRPAAVAWFSYRRAIL